MEMQRVSAHWFQLTGDPWVEVVDKWSGGNVHPDRVMNQWVLVLMLRGQRTFRVYGEDYAVRAGDFFLLPPYVRHCGIEYVSTRPISPTFALKGSTRRCRKSWTPRGSCCPCAGRCRWSCPALA